MKTATLFQVTKAETFVVGDFLELYRCSRPMGRLQEFPKGKVGEPTYPVETERELVPVQHIVEYKPIPGKERWFNLNHEDCYETQEQYIVIEPELRRIVELPLREKYEEILREKDGEILRMSSKWVEQLAKKETFMFKHPLVRAWKAFRGNLW